MITTVNLTVGNILSVNGGNGVAGGSGGSILIYTTFIVGAGSITANGGTGTQMTVNGCTSYGGGGAGGRIAIYFASNTFTGAATAFGGVGFSGFNGGPGTIYTQDNALGFRKLSINNNNSPVVSATLTGWMNQTMGSVAWLTGDDTYEFDEISIIGSASLAMNGVDISAINEVSPRFR